MIKYSINTCNDKSCIGRINTILYYRLIYDTNSMNIKYIVNDTAENYECKLKTKTQTTNLVSESTQRKIKSKPR